jgi:hypothetical protein
MTGYTLYVVTPGANRDCTTVDEHGDDRPFGSQSVFQIPRLVFLALDAVLIQTQLEISFAVSQRDRNQPKTPAGTPRPPL